MSVNLWKSLFLDRDDDHFISRGPRGIEHQKGEPAVAGYEAELFVVGRHGVIPHRPTSSLASGIFGRRQNPAMYATKDGIVEGVEFFPGGRFEDDRIVSHATGCASSDWCGIA